MNRQGNVELQVHPGLGIDQIRNFLPHRYPLLLIDRVLEIRTPGVPGALDEPNGKVGTQVVAIKNISYGESVFQGHFPDFSIFPGVMILEAMAQAASFCVYPFMAKDPSELSQFQCIFVGIDGARFRRPVVPGDTLRLEIECTKFRGKLWGFSCVAYVDGQKAAEADILTQLSRKDGK